jgi:hypothetical protein
MNDEVIDIVPADERPMTQAPVVMSRSDLLRELNIMVAARLFGPKPWRESQESGDAITKRLIEMGLYEEVPRERETWRLTAFGREQHLDLLEVFMGAFDEYDTVIILQNYELVDDPTAESIWQLLGAGVDPESLLKPLVQRAYFEFYNPSELWN